ncbi:hypothetical protein [Pontibacillus salipaludis]|uniref:Uncharacterized protein n=1 Tax=Pontibacillus salipaludis TaxID=1697394 RepID=A0ABQ1PYK0_9BACI|nr:hypothetical protein [Pontibacillus salipaludis]GGD07645.1 hypothetical protein GCM10011389_14010 [Pontibacillus salipaludis]
MTYIRRSVSFNSEDPDQAALLDHASKRKNFSGYVKRLIQRDMERGGQAEIKAEVKPEAKSAPIKVAVTGKTRWVNDGSRGIKR